MCGAGPPIWRGRSPAPCMPAPIHVLTINYFAVVLGGFWGWLFWDQLPDAVSILGSAMVIGGGLLTIYLANRPALSPNEER